jgi:hypothetical protein
MTLKSSWNIASDDHIEFDLNPSPCRSIIRQSIDSNNCLSNSPTDGVNKLSDWFESCSLDENKCRN